MEFVWDFELLPTSPHPSFKTYQALACAPPGFLKKQPVDILVADHFSNHLKAVGLGKRPTCDLAQIGPCVGS
jgi:hypothetical protein